VEDSLGRPPPRHRDCLASTRVRLVLDLALASDRRRPRVNGELRRLIDEMALAFILTFYMSLV
jgi:hypothetical protein